MSVSRPSDGEAGPGDGEARRSDRWTSSSRGSQRDRAVSAVVGKALEAGIVVLYVSVLTATLYGGVVPEYEAAAGAELGERVLAEAAIEVQTAVPEDPRAEATVRYELPETIDGATYGVRAANGSLRLDHPDDAVGGTIPLALPPDVESVRGTWHSHEPGAVRVRHVEGGRVVRLVPAEKREPEGEP